MAPSIINDNLKSHAVTFNQQFPNCELLQERSKQSLMGLGQLGTHTGMARTYIKQYRFLIFIYHRGTERVYKIYTSRNSQHLIFCKLRMDPIS